MEYKYLPPAAGLGREQCEVHVMLLLVQ